MPTLLDTHAWVWWVSVDRRLSRSALDLTSPKEFESLVAPFLR